MTNILLDAVWKGNIPLCNIFSTSLGKIKWIIRNNSIKMKEASKICPGILIIFLRTLLVFQKFFQTHWVFGLQKHADYAWMKSKQTAVDLPAASQGCPRRFSHGRDRTALLWLWAWGDPSERSCRCLHSPAARVPWARRPVTCSPRPLPGLDP